MTGAPRDLFLSLEQVAAMGLPNPFPPEREPWGPLGLLGSTYVVHRQRWVKIGSTRDLTTRLTQLRCPKPGVICPDGMDVSAPLTLILTHKTNIEAELHRQFAAYRVAGEWFDAYPVLKQLGTPL